MDGCEGTVRQRWWERGLRLHSSLRRLKVLRSPIRRGLCSGVGLGEVRRGPCGGLEPYVSTDLPPWVIWEKHTSQAVSSAPPPTSGRRQHKLQAQDTPGSKHTLLSKLLYTPSRGRVAQGCVGTDLWASAW